MQDGSDLLGTDALDRLATFHLLGAVERQVELFLYGFSICVAADRHVAREERLVAGENIDVDGARARVQQDDHGLGVETVVHLVGVLEREGVHVHDHRHPTGLRDDAGIVRDLFFLGRDEQDVHCAGRLGAGSRVENLVIEVHILDVEGDVLFGLPVNRLGELRGGHHRQIDLLDDHGVARQRGGDLLRPERLVLEDTADGVGDRGAVDDGAVDDAVGRHRLDGKRHDLEALPDSLQLDSFDRARPDVEPDDRFF